MQARCRAAFLLFFLPLLCLSTGCSSNKNNKLENELRTRDQQYRDALEEQRRMEGNNAAAHNENEALRPGAKRRPICAPHLRRQTHRAGPGDRRCRFRQHPGRRTFEGRRGAARQRRTLVQGGLSANLCSGDHAARDQDAAMYVGYFGGQAAGELEFGIAERRLHVDAAVEGVADLRKRADHRAFHDAGPACV